MSGEEYLAKLKKYFDETGLDIFIIINGMKIVFEPESGTNPMI